MSVQEDQTTDSGKPTGRRKTPTSKGAAAPVASDTPPDETPEQAPAEPAPAPEPEPAPAPEPVSAPEPAAPAPAEPEPAPEPAPPSAASDVEVWRNEVRHNVGIRRVDAIKGMRVELVAPKRTVTITAEDRRLTENSVPKAENNPFRNGWLYCTSIAETAEDVESIRSDPNMISQSEIEAMFEGNNQHMVKKLAAVTSPVALARILDYANTTGAATSRIDAVKARIAEVGTPDNRDPDAPVTLSAPRDKFYPPELGGQAPAASAGPGAAVSG